MSKYDPRTKIFGLHHDGNMTNDSQEVNKNLTPRIYDNWPEVQIYLTLMVGKAHHHYYQDTLATKQK